MLAETNTSDGSCTASTVTGLMQKDSLPIGRSRHSIGGSHTVVTYPPLAMLEPGESRPILDAVKPEPGINLYAHIAFCEFQCPFCHYETKFRKLRSQADDALDAYMSGLEREWAGWKSRLGESRLGSLYIGGGTPTSIPLPSLTRLISDLLDYPREPGFAFCVETSPASVAGDDGAEALRTLKALGVNRFSMGAQTSNAQLLARSRGHSREILWQAVQNLQELALPYNIDLIQDLPDQNDAALGEDLDFVAATLPPQVTWYILRLESHSAWRPRYDAGLIELPTSEVSIARRLHIIDRMRALGYRMEAGGRFTRLPGESDIYKRVRSQLGDTMLGIGASAYSHGWGWFFRNVYSAPGVNGIKDYVARIERGVSPIADARKITAEDREVSAVLAAVRSRLNPELLQLSEPYRSEVRALVDHFAASSLMAEDDGWLQLTDRGRALEEEICARFYPAAVRHRVGAKPQILSTI